jgi:hypothetical protein
MILVATYALDYSVALLTVDSDFSLIQKAGLPLTLAQA